MMKSLFKNISKKSFCTRYAQTHEWVKKIGGNKVRMGISDHAKSELGEVVYVDLDVKQVGDEVNASEEVCQLESVKAAAAAYTPVTGKLINKNENALEGINESPEDKGWLWELEMTSEDEFKALMTKEDYLKSI